MWTIQRFNSLTAAEVVEALGACCAAEQWTRAVAAARPFDDVDGLVDYASVAFDELDAAAIAAAVAAHPPIGERASGSGTESSWSRQEQGRAADSDAAVAAELADV